MHDEIRELNDFSKFKQDSHINRLVGDGSMQKNNEDFSRLSRLKQVEVNIMQYKREDQYQASPSSKGKFNSPGI